MNTFTFQLDILCYVDNQTGTAALCCEFVKKLLGRTPKVIHATVSATPFDGSRKGTRTQPWFVRLDDSEDDKLVYSWVTHTLSNCLAGKTFYWKIHENL